MIIIKHRINNLKALKNTNTKYGVEIDLRSNNKSIYLHHDPFKKGVLFSKWIKKFRHRLIVLNVKEEGLEKKILNILKINNVKKFFFHDQSFSSLLLNMKKTNVSIRYSEFEMLSNKNYLFKYIKWVWIDNFFKLRLEKKFLKYLKKRRIKTCIVSPELVNKNRIKEIKQISNFIKNNKFLINAICTKNPEIWESHL
jgi:hypothetical protein